jgi:hypothetical protein
MDGASAAAPQRGIARRYFATTTDMDMRRTELPYRELDRVGGDHNHAMLDSHDE